MLGQHSEERIHECLAIDRASHRDAKVLLAEREGRVGHVPREEPAERAGQLLGRVVGVALKLRELVRTGNECLLNSAAAQLGNGGGGGGGKSPPGPFASLGAPVNKTAPARR